MIRNDQEHTHARTHSHTHTFSEEFFLSSSPFLSNNHRYRMMQYLDLLLAGVFFPTDLFFTPAVFVFSSHPNKQITNNYFSTISMCEVIVRIPTRQKKMSSTKTLKDETSSHWMVILKVDFSLFFFSSFSFSAQPTLSFR